VAATGRTKLWSTARRAGRLLAGVMLAAVLGTGGMLAGCATTSAADDPVQIKLRDLDTRLARIERVVANQSLLDLSNQLEALRSDVRALRNDVDVANHTLESARKQQHDLYADLDQRLKVLEGHGAAAPGGSAAAGQAAAAGAGAQAPVADGPDKTSYLTAFDLLKAGLYDRAIVAFESFLATYPNSQLADNGQYWLGEAFYVNKSFPEALAAFKRVVDNYPTSRKLPDALLKIGYCDYELKDYAAARSALSQVTAKFPDVPSAALAQQRLDKMAAEGH
jgi:tol-pal system protein YbgF